MKRARQMMEMQKLLGRLWLVVAIVAGVLATQAIAQSPHSSKGDQGQATAAPDDERNLSGTWKLNADESDNPRDRVQESRSSRRGTGGSGGTWGTGSGPSLGIPGGMGRGGMGRSGGGMGGPGYPSGGSSEPDQRQQGRIRELVAAPEQITIAQKGPEIDVTDSDDHTQQLFTDERKLEKPKKGSNQTQVKAHWDGSRLVAEEKGPNGEKITRSYQVSLDGKQLNETVTLESKRLEYPVSLRYVYDKQ